MQVRRKDDPLGSEHCVDVWVAGQQTRGGARGVGEERSRREPDDTESAASVRVAAAPLPGGISL